MNAQPKPITKDHRPLSANERIAAWHSRKAEQHAAEQAPGIDYDEDLAEGYTLKYLPESVP